jgi:hypothetical protein
VREESKPKRKDKRESEGSDEECILTPRTFGVRAAIALVFPVLVLMGLATILGEIVMRVRLTKLEPSRDKLVWWRRGGDEVSATYQEAFPKSKLPLLRMLVWWIVIGFAGLGLLHILWTKR